MYTLTLSHTEKNGDPGLSKEHAPTRRKFHWGGGQEKSNYRGFNRK